MQDERPDTTEGAHLDFEGRMSYGDYLGLDSLLSAQTPLSDDHNEMLFIIQHQTTELWMKLVLHELKAVVTCLREDRLPPAFKMMARVAKIFQTMNQAWEVLANLTPAEYLRFRGVLGQSSGFQSHQYRAIEFLVGNKNAALLRPHAHRPEIHAELDRLLRAPSLYDEAVAVLSRRGLQVEPAHLARDLTLPYHPHSSVEAAWAAVYADVERHWDLYELAEKLVDLEQAFRSWRFAHVTTVERIIGRKRGTGGTAGVDYLKRVLEVRLFPELWDLRTRL